LDSELPELCLPNAAPQPAVHIGAMHAYIMVLWGVCDLLWTCGKPHKEYTKCK